MSTNNNLIEITVYLSNTLVLIFLAIKYLSGSDKAIFFLLVGVPILILINLITGIVFSILNSDLKNYFYHSVIGLIIISLPVSLMVLSVWLMFS